MSVNKRECVVCERVKPDTEYYSAGVKNGKKYLRRKCKDCYEGVKAHRRYKRHKVKNGMFWLWIF